MNKYSMQGYVKEKMAAVRLPSLGISTKRSIEMAHFIRNKSIAYVKRFLEAVLEEKRALPTRRYCNGSGHKPGIGPGKYPKKVAEEFLRAANLAVKNAIAAGMGSDDASYVIRHAVANRATKQLHYGRQRGRFMKQTHIELVIEEVSPAKKKTAKEPSKKEEPKAAEAKKPEAAQKAQADAPAKAKEEKKQEAKAEDKLKAEAKPKAEEKKEAKSQPQDAKKPEDKE